MIDFIIGIAFCIVFGLVATGIVLQNRDEQQLWEAKKDYTRMQKEVEKNESSRGI
tara:strand:+ start:213 stop:377 length:165 start_codon:yes stop_codon:yes gene_type:complete